METRRSRSYKTPSGKLHLSYAGDVPPTKDISDSSLFRNSLLSVWLEDFSDIKAHFESLRKKGVQDFRSYFEAHPEDVITLAGKVRVIDVNEATLRLYEAESREFFLRGLNIIFDKQSYTTFREELIALAEGRTQFSSEAANCTLLGKELKVLLHLMVLPGSEDRLDQVVVQIVDITAISKREDELSRSEEKYRKIFQHAYDAVLLASLETGIILDANEEAGRMLGMPAGQIVGMHFTEFHLKEEAAKYRRLFEKHATSDRFVSEDLCMVDRGGRRVPVSISSSIIEIGGKRYVAGTILERRRKTAPAPDSSISEPSDHLTPREREILCHIAGGMTGKHIAEKLLISEKTVETHRARIMKKLNLHCTADLVRYAVNAKIV